MAAAAAFLFSIRHAQSVYAHSDVVKSEPGPATEVETPPRKVYVYLDEATDSVFSSLVVFNEAGNQVDLGDGRADPADDEGKRLVASLPPGLEPGKYTVRWRALSRVDGHETRGEFQFSVSGSLDLDESGAEVRRDLIAWLSAGLTALILLVMAAQLIFSLKGSGGSER